MPEYDDFYAFQNDLTSLYEQQQYAEAYQLVLEQGSHFPDHTRDTLYWLMCLAAVQGNTSQALQYFREALNQDHWFPPEFLRKDPDLASLQGISEFEEMVAICEERLQEAQKTARPELALVRPETGGPFPTLFALHGNGGNTENTIDHYRGLSKESWLIALPQSSQIVGANAFVWNDWGQAKKEIQQHYNTLRQEYNIDTDRVVLSGFSMGGGCTIWLSISGAIPTRGFVVLGPYMPEVETLQPFLESAKAKQLRGYIIVGELDKECLAISRKVAELLNAHDIPCELEILSGLRHNFPADFQQHLEKGLAFVLQA